MIRLSSIFELASRMSFKRNGLRWVLVALMVFANSNVSLARGSQGPGKHIAALQQIVQRAFFKVATSEAFYLPFKTRDCDKNEINIFLKKYQI